MSDNTNVRIILPRTEVIRMIGARIRQLTQQFERDRATYPQKLKRHHAQLIKDAQKRLKKLINARIYLDIIKCANELNVDYKLRNNTPAPPTLNVCRLTSLLHQMEMDTRPKISLRATDSMWTLIGFNEKCEIKRADG